MSDNIINFKKVVERDDSLDEMSIQDRVINCFTTRAQTGKCECQYCLYHREAGKMVTEFLAGDILTWEKNNGKKICSHDLKEVLFEALLYINQMEEDDKQKQKDT